jgi:EAL domain-containing protein (putative c-di-GMP-specific phosphodiesterase class I)
MERESLRILVVDDEPFALALIERSLRRLDYAAVDTCADGAAALARLADPATTADVLLLDLQMPDMDGIEVIRGLVAQEYGGSLVLISVEDERMLQTAAKLVQARGIALLGHLQKPVDPAALGALLDGWEPPRARRQRAPGKVYGAEALRAAIAGGQLVNHYQPKVALATGRVTGVECLVRWQHPEDGLVYPDRFIGLAEEQDLIDDLTRAVLAGALAQARKWHDAGLELRVAVNVSMDNLVTLDFPEQVVAAVKAAGMPPEVLTLEVTESRLMRDLTAALDILTRLRLKRIRLSIDDFGTGHSSLTQLADIPFDELKIDRSFIHGAGRDRTLQAIYDANLQLARGLGMEVVAEGVEDAADWAYLRRTGCDLAQGYFIARPMPAAAVPEWIANWRPPEAA